MLSCSQFARARLQPLRCTLTEPAPLHTLKTRTRSAHGCAFFWRTRAASPSPDDLQRIAAEAEKDPATKQQMEQMQQMMSDPAAQAQLQQTMAAMQTPDMQRRMAALREDPEIMEIMQQAQAGGIGGMMKLMQDQSLLAKIGAKMGDMSSTAGALSGDVASPATAPSQAPASSAAATTNQPDIVSLLDAAKYGDLEATEDLIAVRKDVNQRDAEQRTPLHYAIAYNHPDIMQELLDAGADLTALDSKGNSPLHYAAGYGRAEATQVLLEAGCTAADPNGSGHRPFELVKMDANNPINKDSVLLTLLQAVVA